MKKTWNIIEFCNTCKIIEYAIVLKENYEKFLNSEEKWFLDNMYPHTYRYTIRINIVFFLTINTIKAITLELVLGFGLI